MFTFCRDLGAFAGKIERRVFWAFLGKYIIKTLFYLLETFHFSFQKGKERE